MSYFPEPHSHSRNKVKAELNLSNCGRKSGLKTFWYNRLMHEILLNFLIH